jgi:hypothetical protein
LYAWHCGQKVRAVGMAGLTLSGSSVCALAGPWHVSQERSLWYPVFFLLWISPWHSSHAWNPAYLTGLAFSRLTASAHCFSTSLTESGISTKYANAPKATSADTTTISLARGSGNLSKSLPIARYSS